MTKKTGIYRHALFKRGDLDSLQRIRPSTAINRRKKNDRRENDEAKSSNTIMPVTPSSEYIDDEGDKVQTNLASSCHNISNRPPMRSISLERVEPDIERIFSFDSAMCDVALSQEHDICSTTACGSSNFDLFDDDMEGINFCNCNGCGCCF